jgi:hypothetical protein
MKTGHFDISENAAFWAQFGRFKLQQKYPLGGFRPDPRQPGQQPVAELPPAGQVTQPLWRRA